MMPRRIPAAAEGKSMEQSRRKRLLTLFFSMLYISAFTFGGGFVIVTFMKRKLLSTRPS